MFRDRVIAQLGGAPGAARMRREAPIRSDSTTGVPARIRKAGLREGDAGRGRYVDQVVVAGPAAGLVTRPWPPRSAG